MPPKSGPAKQKAPTHKKIQRRRSVPEKEKMCSFCIQNDMHKSTFVQYPLFKMSLMCGESYWVPYQRYWMSTSFVTLVMNILTCSILHGDFTCGLRNVLYVVFYSGGTGDGSFLHDYNCKKALKKKGPRERYYCNDLLVLLHHIVCIASWLKFDGTQPQYDFDKKNEEIVDADTKEFHDVFDKLFGEYKHGGPPNQQYVSIRLVFSIICSHLKKHMHIYRGFLQMFYCFLIHSVRSFFCREEHIPLVDWMVDVKELLQMVPRTKRSGDKINLSDELKPYYPFERFYFSELASKMMKGELKSKPGEAPEVESDHELEGEYAKFKKPVEPAKKKPKSSGRVIKVYMPNSKEFVYRTVSSASGSGDESESDESSSESDEDMQAGSHVVPKD